MNRKNSLHLKIQPLPSSELLMLSTVLYCQCSWNISKYCLMFLFSHKLREEEIFFLNLMDTVRVHAHIVLLEANSDQVK